MTALNVINKIFVDEDEAAQLEVTCHDLIRKKYPRQQFYFATFKNSINRYMVWIALCLMMYSLSYAQTNFITWIFFFLNVNLMALVARGGKDIKIMKHTLNFSLVIKYYSVLVILVDILFIFLIGEESLKNNPNSFDEKLHKACPLFYKYLDYIGLRIIKSTGSDETDKPGFINQMYCTRFTAYIVYMLFSFYISG
jgi:hypothetical protein